MRNSIFLLSLELLGQVPEMRLKLAKKLLILADFKLIGLLKNREVFFHFAAQQLIAKLLRFSKI